MMPESSLRNADILSRRRKISVPWRRDSGRAFLGCVLNSAESTLARRRSLGWRAVKRAS
ncbi:uncharacterized protein BJX67DRAFT_362311 [Aspergillus lucknowensis]|uniref:Uncharacterized protein n=1 Tax=Aspergillus lucknowensis TaxID=176173 RepID=A0ABR4LHR7_9EURO